MQLSLIHISLKKIEEGLVEKSMIQNVSSVENDKIGSVTSAKGQSEQDIEAVSYTHLYMIKKC